MVEYAAVARFWRGRALLGAKQISEAETNLQAVAESARRIGRPRLLVDAHQALAECCAAAGRTTEAERHQAAADAASALIQRPELLV